MRSLLAPLAPFAAALALAACGSSDEAGNNSADADVPSGAAQEPVPADLTIDNSQRAVPITLPSPSPVAAIPAAFQGRWGLVVNDCTPGRADAKGLMTVGADTLTFYESRARADRLAAITPTKLGGTLAYSGEGQTWQKPTTLTLQDDGKTLVREETDPVAAYTYSKCPG